jgi:hypothetical protein
LAVAEQPLGGGDAGLGHHDGSAAKAAAGFGAGRRQPISVRSDWFVG